MEKLLPLLQNDTRKKILQFKEIVQDIGRGKSMPKFETEEWKGYHFPLIFSAEVAKKFYKDGYFNENSVIISTFPKSGTNWIVEITQQILYGDDEIMSEIMGALPMQLTFLETYLDAATEIMSCLPAPRKQYVTHLPPALLNLEKVKKSNSKIIVTVRNPKDQAISWYHFTKGPLFEQLREHYNPDWSKFFSDYIEGKQPVPGAKTGEGYIDFLLQWYERKQDGNILFVHFEDLKKDAVKEIRRIAKFLEVELTEARVSDIAHKTSFASMKIHQQGDSDKAAVQRAANMIRKGKAGSWREMFTAAQSEMMDAIVDEKLKDKDLKFKYI